jgi:hypothetical protein
MLHTRVRISRGGPIAMAKRTTHRSSKGTKLYAVRTADGEFKDIQTYKRAHGGDIKRKSAPEGVTATKAKAKKAKTAKKAKKAKKAVKKVAKRAAKKR